MQQFRKDGFDTVLLVVPWAQFQPGTAPISYDDRMFARLQAIFESAALHDMGVVLRLAYLWEASPVLEQTYRRFKEYIQREDLRLAWKAYLRKLYDSVLPHKNFRFAFLSWEDFYWPIFRSLTTGSLESRQQYAHISGFRDYLLARFTLLGLNSIYSLNLKSWSEVAIPTSKDFLYEQFIRFYENEILDPICCAALESFPGLHMELRVDPEWIATGHGRKYYHWNMNFPGITTKVIYYHANIARSHVHKHSGEGAVGHLRDLLTAYCRMVELDEKKPFIDQFNFFDDTFTDWTKISEDAVPEFVEKSYDVLMNHSSGYAIWGYLDWPKDIVFNGSFDLGIEGWQLLSGASLVEAPEAKLNGVMYGAYCLQLEQGQAIEQSNFVLSLPEGESRTVAIYGRALQDIPARITVQFNANVVEVELKNGEDQVITATFKDRNIEKLRLTTVAGSALISKVQLYDRYYSQGFRTQHGEARPVVEAFQILNRKLAAKRSG